MQKPSFTLLTIFWLMMVACAFLGGRASFRPQLEEAQARMTSAVAAHEARTAQVEYYKGREQDDAIRQLRSLFGNWHDVRIWDGRVQGVEAGVKLLIQPETDGAAAQVVELLFVQCPTAGEPLGSTAKQFVEANFLGRYVWVVEKSGSPNGAFVFALSDANSDHTMTALNRAILAAGLARCDPSVSGMGFSAIDTALRLRDAETNARGKQLGLWAD